MAGRGTLAADGYGETRTRAVYLMGSTAGHLVWRLGFYVQEHQDALQLRAAGNRG